jgi:transposase-like protein
MSRIRYSAEIRQHALTLVLESHLPVAQAAREAGCSVNSLHYWIKQHRQKNNPPTSPATFVPINIVDASNHSAEIILPNGITIRLTDASAHSIAELILALAPC